MLAHSLIETVQDRFDNSIDQDVETVMNIICEEVQCALIEIFDEIEFQKGGDSHE